MRKSPTWLALVICALFSPARAYAQSLPLLNMGYSGPGIASDLLKAIERAGFGGSMALTCARSIFRAAP